MEFIWLVVFIILLGIEFATMALTTIWFAGGALVAFFIALFGGSLEIQLIGLVVVSLILLIFTRPFLIKYVNAKTVRTNVGSLIGQQARVTAQINNLQASGAVMVNGVEWTARSQSNDLIIEKDTVVIVKEIHGVKLIVEPIKNKEVIVW